MKNMPIQLEMYIKLTLETYDISKLSRKEIENKNAPFITKKFHQYFRKFPQTPKKLCQAITINTKKKSSQS